MAQREVGFDVTLIDPSTKQLTTAVTQAIKAANLRRRTARLTSAPAEVVAFLRERPSEGWHQWLGGTTEPQRNAPSALALAWWTDALGRCHVRVKGLRWAFRAGPETLTSILCPYADERPPVWLVYPEYIYLAGTGPTARVLAVCPCGVAGTLDALGWMGDRCAACHDRLEDGVDVPQRQHFATWKVEYNYIEAVAFSPDGRYLATTTVSSGLRVRDLVGGTVYERKWDQFTLGTDLAFRPDGSLAVLERREVLFLDPITFERRGGFPLEHAPARLTPSPDGRQLVIQGGGLAVWDGNSGKRHFEIASFGELVSCCSAYHPNGRSLAVGCGAGQIRWWTTADGREADPWSVPGTARRGIVELAISPDGRYLASLMDDMADNLHLWDVAGSTVLETWTLNRRRYHPRPNLRLLVFSPDSRTLVASERAGVLKFWDVVARDTPVALASVPEPEIRTLAFSPDGRWLACGCERGLVKLWPWEPLVAAARR